MRVLHLSDTHLSATPDRARAHLRAVIDHARSQAPCQVIVVSGDVSNDGSGESYEAVHGLVSELAEAWSAPIIYTAGNHDRAEVMTEVLGYEPTSLHEAGGYRFAQAQTSVAGRGYGYLGPRRDWLFSVCDEETIVVMHHPPSPPPTLLHSSLALVDRGELAGLTATAILAGHYHTPRESRLGQVPVFVGPACVNETATDLGYTWESATISAGYEILTIDEGVTRELHRVEVDGDGQQLFVYTPDQVRSIAAEFGYETWSDADRWSAPIS